MGCFTTLIFIAGFVLVMVTLLRWFEQITDAVDFGWWNRVMTLIAVPFLVWFYPSRIGAGRPTPFPLHEPVRGFGTVPKAKVEKPAESAGFANGAKSGVGEAPPFAAVTSIPAPAPPDQPPTDQPPPGTPPEFLGLPKMPPPKPKRSRPGVDPDKIEKLRQKMREQGMLGPEE